MTAISPDNRTIHGMWVGDQLSRLELLTLASFTHFGHQFHLWAYDDLSRHALPKGVSLRDASEIIPRHKVFARSGIDPETGVGRNSFGAPFSDLFRFKLLHKHGGIWVDMDVTCLRPFDFKTPYAFRPHRIGVVGSILKCPKGSKLMQRIFEETARSVDSESAYLTPNRILTKHVEAAGLRPYLIENLSNPDNWIEFIRPLIERQVEIPADWYAIHWINEMWRTLRSDGGYYRGRKLLDYLPDKDAPHPGSTLWELYRKYGLIDPREGPEGLRPVRVALPKPAPVLPVHSLKDQPPGARHLNVLLPSLVRGGAERAVIETMAALRDRPGLTQRLYVVHRSRRQYPIGEGGNLRIAFSDRAADDAAAMRAIAFEVLLSGAPVIYTHLIPVALLRHLWEMSVATIPVVQNAEPGWHDPPAAYDDPHVPFLVAVSDAVAEELRAAGCPKPVVTLRHELQRFYTPTELSRHRRDIRDRYGIADNTLLIGMVGQFKSQKAYTRAVRVLERVRRHIPAKLMILGGWDQDYGGARAAYEATCRRAVDLGVIADMIMPGDVHPIDPYLAAFDVFMNTSIHEGLSVALLEAIQAGCPVVTADVGGNREVLPERAVLVKDSADIDGYVDGIFKLVHVTDRILPQPGPETAAMTRLWPLLARHGIADGVMPLAEPAGTLFVTQNLHIGGPQQSLVNLLAGLPAGHKAIVCALEAAPLEQHKRRLDQSRIPIFSAGDAATAMDKAEAVLNWIEMLRVRKVCFWNLDPKVKLAIAKILSVRDIRLIDVSPGPMLFDELANAAAFQRRLAFTASQYFARLDRFVAKYADGLPPPSMGIDRRKIRIIPNGVPRAPNFVPLPPVEFMLPRDRDPSLAIGTCCRFVPDKRIEFLLEAMALLSRYAPGSSLTIVGGPDLGNQDYFEAIRGRVMEAGLDNVFFAGEQQEVLPFLGQFRLFVMYSDRQGCPNASLEAMSMGLPIIANRSGGVAEQVEDGVNGYLVASPAEMADRAITLLKNKRLRERMGKASRAIARKRFSMEKMVEAYQELLAE
ncbi:MAG TPA: glycosyltransferase [Candidatus Udaeobacter sp.]|nr:glycosyltransferase [Candidatus Udaeobacter sp.]